MTQNKKRRRFRYRPTWKDYFTLSNRVRRGLIVLLTLLLVEIGALVYFKYKPHPVSNLDIAKIRNEIDAFYGSVPPDSTRGSRDELAAAASADDLRTAMDGQAKGELFAFNPNQLPEAEWSRLGLSAKQIRSIKNFESKGGRFRTKDDVRKMYAITPSEYKRLEPFIMIPDPQQDIKRSERKKTAVDIGTADSTELEKLPMVGPWLAQKICRFRESLGGFYSIGQLREVRGMRDSTFQIILPMITLKDSTNLRRMNLNEADFDELNSHPYIDYTLANIIVNYRKQHGRFASTEGLKKVSLVNEELYRKIAPYLKAE